MNKPKVVFTFVDAGSGHIVPLTCIYKAFEKKYGQKVDLVKSDFFFENGNKKLAKYGNITKNGVVQVNKNWFVRNFIRVWTLLPVKVGLNGMIHTIATAGTQKAALEHIKELNADVHITNHFFPSFFYTKSKKDKDTLNMLINMDCLMIKNNLYPCDILFTVCPDNLKDYPKKYKRLNESNFKAIPYPLRDQFNVDLAKLDKKNVRAKLNINPDKFTIAILEGGYGVGKGFKVFEKLLKTNLDLNIIYFAGKNKKLLNKLNSMVVPNNISLYPLGYTYNIAEHLLASDLVLVKAGANTLAETAALGLPTIVMQTGFVHEIGNAKYYQDKVGNSFYIPNPNKVVEKIQELYTNPVLLKQLSNNAINNHLELNNEKIADALFAEIKKRFPNI